MIGPDERSAGEFTADMSLFPGKHFTWQEPKEFRQILKASERAVLPWWVKPPAVASFTTSMFMLLWVETLFNSKIKPLSFTNALLASLIGGVLLGYFVPWMISKLPFTVAVYEQSITWTRGYAHGVRFRDLKSFSWFHAPGFSILRLNPRKGGQTLIGVPPGMSTGALTAFLLERHVPQEPSSGGEDLFENQISQTKPQALP